MQSWQRRGAEGQGSRISSLVLENRYKLWQQAFVSYSRMRNEEVGSQN